MQALLGGTPDAKKMPHLAEWLELAAPVREVIGRNYNHLTDAEARATAAAEENVLFALENLRAYPCVTQKVAEEKLRLHAWFFKIATAELFAYDPDAQQFAPLIAAKK